MVSAVITGPRLSKQTLSRLPDTISGPGYDLDEVTIGQVHLGLGGFHRAHQAWCTDTVLAADPRWGISAFTWRNTALPASLAEQDCLYSLLAADQNSETVQVLGAIRRAHCATTDPDRFRADVACARTEVLTLTVTEKAYPRAADGCLDITDPAVAADLSEQRPHHSVVGLIVSAIAERARAGSGPLAVISCDNLRGNGEVLRRLVTGFVQAHQVSRGRRLYAWIADNVTFPSTVVDRIVPDPDPAAQRAVHRLAGVDDHAAVLTEPFFQWVVQDDFRGERPPWEHGGAVLVGDLHHSRN